MKSAYVLSVTMHFPNYRDQSQAQDNRNLNLQQEWEKKAHMNDRELYEFNFRALRKINLYEINLLSFDLLLLNHNLIKHLIQASQCNNNRI